MERPRLRNFLNRNRIQTLPDKSESLNRKFKSKERPTSNYVFNNNKPFSNFELFDTKKVQGHISSKPRPVSGSKNIKVLKKPKKKNFNVMSILNKTFDDRNIIMPTVFERSKSRGKKFESVSRNCIMTQDSRVMTQDSRSIENRRGSKDHLNFSLRDYKSTEKSKPFYFNKVNRLQAKINKMTQINKVLFVKKQMLETNVKKYEKTISFVIKNNYNVNDRAFLSVKLENPSILLLKNRISM